MKIESKILKFAPGEILFQEGDTNNGIYLVQEGEFEVYRTMDGHDVTLGTLKHGDFIGTLTLLSGENRSASVRASSAATLLLYNNTAISHVFKTIPIWIQAVLKDAIARLTHVNTLLLETRINEDRLKKKILSKYQLSGQLAYLLVCFTKLSPTREGEPARPFLLSAFLINCEKIFFKEGLYIEKIIKILEKCGLLTLSQVSNIGTTITVPNSALLEDYWHYVDDYALSLPKKNLVKMHSWLDGLIRIQKKYPTTTQFSPQELIALLEKELGHKDGQKILDDLVDISAIKRDANDKISFSSSELQKKITFESIFDLLKALKEE